MTGEVRRRRGKRRRGVARHGRLTRSNAWLNAAGWVASTMAVVIVAAVSVTAIETYRLVDDVETFTLEPVVSGDDDVPDAPDVGAASGAFTMLLSGSDTREGQGGLGGPDDGTAPLNDVNILLHVNADHTRAVAVSIPRDLLVPIPSCTDPGTGRTTPAMSSQQINTALQYGGMPCVAATISQLTGMPVDYAGLITFRGVVDMTNAVGGVPVCVSGPVDDARYSGLVIRPDEIAADGTVVLQGEQALGFLRNRHGLQGGSDLSRISGQQVYLSSMVRTLTSSGTLTDLGAVYGLARAAVGSMELSSNLTQLDTIVSLAQAVKGIDPAQITFVQLPVVDGTGANANRVLPRTADVAELFALIEADEPFALADGSVRGGAELVETPAAGAPDAGAGTPGTGAGTAAPGAPAPSGGASAPPTAAGGGGEDDPVETLTDVSGQTAAQRSCARITR